MPAPDFWNMLALERGAPLGWCWTSLEARPSEFVKREHGAIVKGCVPKIITRGPRKGEKVRRHRDPLTFREFAIPFKEFDARLAQWELDTGKCSECGDDGTRVAGGGGNQARQGQMLFDQCSRCGGTGKAKAATKSDASVPATVSP